MLVLIAQTPRAGKWHNQMLLPPGELPAGFRPLDYVAASRHTGVGADYVAVWADVEQPTTGRVGREVLVLIGVTPDESQLANLRVWLRARLVELGDLIMQRDWQRHDGSDVRLVELSMWCAEAVEEFKLVSDPRAAKAFRTNNRSGGPHRGAAPAESDIEHRSRRSFPRWRVTVTLVGFLAASAAGIGLWNSKKGSNNPTSEGERPTISNPTGQEKKSKDDQEFSEFMEAFCPDIGKRSGEEKALLKALPKILDLRRADYPTLSEGSEDVKPQAELRKWVTQHPDLKAWKKKAFPTGERENDWAYFGKVDDDKRKQIEQVMGTPKTIDDVRIATERFKKLHGFLADCCNLVPKAYAAGAEDRGFSNWFKQLHPDRLGSAPITPLPFFPEIECQKYTEIVSEIASLRRQMKKDHLLVEEANDPLNWNAIQKMARVGVEATEWYRDDSSKKPKEKPNSVGELNGKYAASRDEFEAVKTLLAKLGELADPK